VTPTNIVGSETITVTLSPDTSYDLGNPNTATIALTGNTIPVRSLTFNEAGATMSWNSTPNRTYRVAYKNQLSDPVWTNLADCKATNSIWTWVDPEARTVPQRFYLVAEVVIGD
jgi:hypothetical protein